MGPVMVVVVRSNLNVIFSIILKLGEYFGPYKST